MGAEGGGGRVIFHGGPRVRIPPTALCCVFEKWTSSSLLSTGWTQFNTRSGHILSRRAGDSYWRKYVHFVQVNRLGGQPAQE